MKKKILIPVGMAALLCVLASSGNYGFTGPFVFGRQREILVCNKQGRL